MTKAICQATAAHVEPLSKRPSISSAKKTDAAVLNKPAQKSRIAPKNLPHDMFVHSFQYHVLSDKAYTALKAHNCYTGS
jgi:hypothetical protein